MILQAAYRLASDTAAAARYQDHEADAYDTAYDAARNARGADEVLLFVRRVDADAQ